MKPTLFAIVSLILGIALGWVWTRSEFSRDVLPLVLVSKSDVSGTATKGPRAVVVNGERFDFGTMDRFAKGKHEFQISNDGDAPLELKLGKTTCKCTLGELNSSKLAPGETTIVTLTWEIKTGESMFEQNAELITNDPQHNPIHLTIYGTVIDTLNAEDLQFTLNGLSANETTTVRLRIFAFREKNLQIEKHQWLKPESADHFEVTFEPLPAEEVAARKAVSGIAVVLKVLPGLPLGPLSQTLRLTTNVENRDPLEIPVFGTVVSDISLAGPGVTASRLLVNLGTVERGVGAKRTVYIVVKGPHRAGTKLQMVSAEPKIDFKATLGETIRDNPKIDRYPLTIEIPETAAPVARTGNENFGRVRFQVTHPQVNELTVLVRYVVKE